MLQKLLSENIKERVAEMNKLENNGYPIEKILEFCRFNSKTTYDIRFVKIPMEKIIYIGEISLTYEICDDFPEALDNYGTRDLYRTISIENSYINIENFRKILLSNDIIDFDRSFEEESDYHDYVQAMNLDIDMIFDKILNCKKLKIDLINCLK